MKWAIRSVCIVTIGAAMLVLSFPPLATTEEKLLFIRMTHFLVLGTVVSPLLVLGGIFEFLEETPIARAAAYPFAAWTLFVCSFLLWHWPPALQFATETPLGRLVEYTIILAAGTLFWAGALFFGPYNEMGYGARVLYVVTAAIATDLPSISMILAPSTTRIWSIPESLMWLPANFVFAAATLWLLARWASEGTIISIEEPKISANLVHYPPPATRLAAANNA